MPSVKHGGGQLDLLELVNNDADEQGPHTATLHEGLSDAAQPHVNVSRITWSNLPETSVTLVPHWCLFVP